MLSPVYLSLCTDDILRLYEELNDSIIRDIVRRLVALDFNVSSTAVWQLERLQDIGYMVYEEALAEISKSTDKTENELKKLFEEAGTKSMQYDNEVYRRAGLSPLPLSQSAGMLQVLTAGYQKCKGELKNLTLTTANASQSLFVNACNAAYMQTMSGAFSMNTAIKNAINMVGDSGAWVVYPSGHRDRLDVAVRRAVQTGVSQTCGQLQISQLDDMMWDVVDVTAHMGARMEHAVWQGGRFSYKGRNKNYPDFEASTGYGSADGLMGINCRHNFYPAVDGTPRMYSTKQLAEWKTHKVTYNGTDFSDREALDIQRTKERNIRSVKRELTALDEGIRCAEDEALKRELAEEFSAKSLRLSQQEAALKDFLEQTELKRDYSRSQLQKFGRSMSGKAKAAKAKETERIHYIEKIKPALPKKQKAKDTVLQDKLDFDIIYKDKPKQGIIPAKVDLVNVNIIAGYGSSCDLRVDKKLSRQYGGEIWKWQKKTGTAKGVYGEYEIHWYEYDGIQYDTKLKGYKAK